MDAIQPVPTTSGGRSPIDVGGDAFVLAGLKGGWWSFSEVRWYLGLVFHTLLLHGAGVGWGGVCNDSS